MLICKHTSPWNRGEMAKCNSKSKREQIQPSTEIKIAQMQGQRSLCSTKATLGSHYVIYIDLQPQFPLVTHVGQDSGNAQAFDVSLSPGSAQFPICKPCLTCSLSFVHLVYPFLCQLKEFRNVLILGVWQKCAK